MSKTIGKVYVDAVITDEQYKECMALVSEANERIDELERENAKLRELVRDMYKAMDVSCQFGHPVSIGTMAHVKNRVKGLGVEVDG